MTIKQIQCLLTYLGYSPGGIDGVDGKNTIAAVKRFQSDYGLTSDGDAGAATQKMLTGAVAGTAVKVKQTAQEKTEDGQQTGTYWDTIKYFKRSDPYIGCPCGKCGGFPVEPKEKLMRLADRVREAAGKPMIPNSTVRCAAHNKAVGGVDTSRHLLGQAMDFHIPGMSAAQILAIVKADPATAYCYAIDSSNVHMDVIYGVR